MKNIIGSVILISLLLVGCKMSQQMELEPESFLQWYSSGKNSFKSKDTINDICYSFAFYPKEVSIAVCALNSCEPKDVLLKELKSKSENPSYLFELTSLNPLKDLFESSSAEMSKNEQIIYMNNGIKNDLKALTKRGDTLKCVSAIYEPLLASKFRLIVDFESSESGSVDQIIYIDRLMSRSQIKFNFSNTIHTNFPLLNLKNYEK